MAKNDIITISTDLKNTGKMSADEVMQVYVHRINPSVEWPEKELKAFARVTLNPQESKTTQLTIPVKNLMYWNEKKQSWDNDLCRIEIMIGASSGDIKLKKEITLR